MTDESTPKFNCLVCMDTGWIELAERIINEENGDDLGPRKIRCHRRCADKLSDPAWIVGELRKEKQ